MPASPYGMMSLTNSTQAANEPSDSKGIFMKKFIHLDMDAYFVSVELLDAPHLRSAPVAVGGTAVERGVISTANYLARQFGIKSGMATATAQRLCPALVLLPVRFERYEAVTRQLERLFKRYTDRVEFFSLDEASLEVTGQSYCGGSATRMASALRAEVHAELGLTASAGVAPLRYLAKIASEINKPNGQFVIPPRTCRAFWQIWTSASCQASARRPGGYSSVWGVGVAATWTRARSRCCCATLAFMAITSGRSAKAASPTRRVPATLDRLAWNAHCRTIAQTAPSARACCSRCCPRCASASRRWPRANRWCAIRSS